MAELKTNVMRILDQKKINYSSHEYPHEDGAVDGVSVAALTGLPVERVYKTLVTRGASKRCYVFVIPAADELDLKKAAASVSEKSVTMVHVSEINELTGYVRGGCSPVGMKKQFKTVFHSAITQLDSVAVSAGKIGSQIELTPAQLITLVRGETADITVSR